MYIEGRLLEGLFDWNVVVLAQEKGAVASTGFACSQLAWPLLPAAEISQPWLDTDATPSWEDEPHRRVAQDQRAAWHKIFFGFNLAPPDPRGRHLRFEGRRTWTAGSC